MKYQAPLPIQYVGDVALAQLNKANPDQFVAWLLQYWHLVEHATRADIVSAVGKRYAQATGAAKHYIDSRYGAWQAVVQRQATPGPLDNIDWTRPLESLSLVERARQLAVLAHDGAGQLYSGQPYGTHHLYPVAVLAEQYAYLLPVQMHETVIAGAWLHDFVEDAYGSMNDLTKLLNLAIARTAQLCVSSTGATRAERHDAAYHGRVASTMESTYVKLVDRLRNVTAGDGTRKGDSMREGYRKEQPAFESHLAVAGNYPNLLPLMDAINTALGL